MIKEEVKESGKVSPPIDGKWGVEAAPNDAQVISYDGLLPQKGLAALL